MREGEGCFVVDKDGNLIVMEGVFNCFLRTVPDGLHTHVLISYYKNSDDAIQKIGLVRRIFLKEQVFFGMLGK